MTAADWPEVRRIYAEGIATGDATLEREAPDWGHFDRSHPPDCRLVAPTPTARSLVDGARRLFGAGSTRRRLGERLRGGDARGQGVGRRLSRRSSRRPRPPASGRCWPASWPTTRRASPSTNASASDGRRPAPAWPGCPGTLAGRRLAQRRSATIGRDQKDSPSGPFRRRFSLTPTLVGRKIPPGSACTARTRSVSPTPEGEGRPCAAQCFGHIGLSLRCSRRSCASRSRPDRRLRSCRRRPATARTPSRR